MHHSPPLGFSTATASTIAAAPASIATIVYHLLNLLVPLSTNRTTRYLLQPLPIVDFVESAAEEETEGEYEVAHNKATEPVADTKAKQVDPNDVAPVDNVADEIGAQAAQNKHAKPKESEEPQLFTIVWPWFRVIRVSAEDEALDKVGDIDTDK